MEELVKQNELRVEYRAKFQELIDKWEREKDPDLIVCSALTHHIEATTVLCKFLEELGFEEIVSLYNKVGNYG